LPISSGGEVGHGIGNRVVIFQAQQRPQLRPVEFLFTDLVISA
jgi:hypothetical protein